MTPWRLLLWCWLLWIPVVSQATELTLWHTWRGAEAEALTQLSEAWGAQNDVQVRLIALPFGAFDSKLETAVPRGNGPDLFLAGHGALGKWTTPSQGIATAPAAPCR